VSISSELGYIDKIQLFKRDARLFVASNATGSFAFGFNSVIFNLYMVEGGFSEDFLGFFLSVSMFATALIAIGAGMVSDRRSRKKIMLAASLISFVSFIIQYTVLDPVLLVMSQIFYGFSSAFTQVSWSPYITELSTNEERAHLFGVSGGISLLTVLAGNILGGFLPQLLLGTLGPASSLFFAYRYTLLISLIPMAISSLLVIPMSSDSPAQHSSRLGFDNVRNWSFIGKYSTTVATVGLGAGMIVLFFNIFFSNVFQADSSLIGLIFGINTIVLAIGNFSAPALADRIGKVKTVVLTEALSIPFLLMIAWSPFLYLAVVAYVSRTVLMNMAGPVSNAFFMEGLSKEERATAVGIVRSGDSLVRGIAANIGGILLAAGLYRLPYILVSGLYVLAVILFYLFFRKEEKTMRAAQEAKMVIRADEEIPEAT